MSTIGNAYKHFGWRGLYIYYQVKTGRAKRLHVPGIQNEIHLRQKTDDAKLFKQLLIHREYNFHAPIKPGFIIDGGANIGLSSLYFAGTYPSAQVVAIEAQKENYHLLLENVKNYPNIKCLNAGLWHKSTTLEVTDSRVGTTGFMVHETSSDNPNGFKAISVQEILQVYNQAFIDLFKIDIEGAEKELLSENVDWISKTKMIVIELHDRKKPGCSQAFFAAFRDRNFECHPFGQNFLLFNKDLI